MARPIMFKQVAGGWLYRAPNPWLFGDAPRCLVTDAQTVQIEDRMSMIPFWLAYFAAIFSLGRFFMGVGR